MSIAPMVPGVAGMYPMVDRRNRAHICSVFPVRLQQRYSHVGTIPNPNYDPKAPQGSPESQPEIPTASQLYIMEAAPRDGYTTLTVLDTAQLVQNVAMPDSDYELMPAPIHAHQLRESLVQKWTAYTVGATSESRIGIGAIVDAEPSEQEVEYLRKIQAHYFQYLVVQGDQHWRHGEVKNIIDLHFQAADWLNVIDSHEWARGMQRREMKDCLACRNGIDAHAVVCEHCNKDLIHFLDQEVDWLTDNEMAKVDPFAWSQVVKRRAKRAAKLKLVKKGKAGAEVKADDFVEP